VTVSELKMFRALEIHLNLKEIIKALHAAFSGARGGGGILDDRGKKQSGMEVGEGGKLKEGKVRH
jgi:hypothetical protein